jgi:hypothetical protein
MRITKRSKRRLPSPLELSFYLFAVIAFCVINWTLLKTVNPDKPAPKSIESVIVEEMLKDLDPVILPEDEMMTIDVNNFAELSEQTLKLEPWMLNFEAFSRFNTESEIILEDWMINTSTWNISGFLGK